MESKEIHKLLYEVVFLGLYTNWIISAYDRLIIPTNNDSLLMIQQMFFILAIGTFPLIFHLKNQFIITLLWVLQITLISNALYINRYSIPAEQSSTYLRQNITFVMLGYFLWMWIQHSHREFISKDPKYRETNQKFKDSIRNMLRSIFSRKKQS